MYKSGLTSATLQILQRKARKTAEPFDIEKEMTMTVTDEPELASDVFSDGGKSEDDVVADLPGEPWDSDWEITDPVSTEFSDASSKNLEDATMARRIFLEK